ncbi:IS256 family transposase [bacterium]|nr:IS256 family transposase [bacterium]
MFKITVRGKGNPEVGKSIDDLAREGAREMIVKALEVEVEEYLSRLKEERDEHGHALVTGNGDGKERTVLIGCGAVKIRAPRVDDRRPGKQFRSLVLPPYMRKSPNVTEVLPLLYLKGVSTGNFGEALAALFGEGAKGLSPSVISRLKKVWEADYEAFRKRDLSGKNYVYVWADGVHVSIRLGEENLCLLVILGVTTEGDKEVIAIADGYRESTESWASVLRDLKRRGMKAPILAVGDGALGFWAAVRNVWPKTKEQRCWVHKIANVLDKLPKRLQPPAKGLLHEIMNAPDRETFSKGMKVFEAEYQAKYPKATECLLKDRTTLATFYDFPAEHWKHLRTTNPIESPFATVKLRTRTTKGAGSRTAGLMMAFKLMESAEKRWQKIRGAELAAEVWRGANFVDGVQIRCEERIAA